jgi:hypothetical protein
MYQYGYIFFAGLFNLYVTTSSVCFDGHPGSYDYLVPHGSFIASFAVQYQNLGDP